MRALSCIVLSAFVALTGCAIWQQPQQRVVTVQVKVKEPCISSPPTRPAYQTGKGEYPGERAAAKVLADDFERAEQYGHQWEAAAAGCIGTPPGD